MTEFLAQSVGSDLWQTLVLDNLPVVAALVLFLYGFYQEWWVTGKIYRRRVEEVDALLQERNELQEKFDTYRQGAEDRHNEYRDRVERETLPVLIRVADNLTSFIERRRGMIREHDDT